jgi:hypothetical protein
MWHRVTSLFTTDVSGSSLSIRCSKHTGFGDNCDGTAALILLRRNVPVFSLKLGHYVPFERGQCPGRSLSQLTMPLEEKENTRRKVTPSLVSTRSDRECAERRVEGVLENGRFLTLHLDRCCTTPLLCLTCVKTYVKIKVSKLSTFHE